MRHKYPLKAVFIRRKMLLPSFSGLILLLLTLSLYWKTNQEDVLNIQKMTQAKADESILDIKSDLQDKKSSIDRLARRWEISGGTPKAAFVDEILQRQNDFPGLNIVLRVDRMNQPQWTIPNSSAKDMQLLIASMQTQYNNSLNIAKTQRRSSLSAPILLHKQSYGLVLYTPLFANRAYDGCVIEVLNIPQWLNHLLADNTEPEIKNIAQFSFSVSIDDRLVYQQQTNNEFVTSLTAKSNTKFFNHHVSITATPSKGFILNNSTMTPTITLISGIVLSALVAFIIYLLEKNIEQTRQLRHSEKKYIRQANYDLLTDLPSRRLVEERIAYIISSSNRNELLVAILFIDLDGFKQVNDTYGHYMGDLLLQEVANRLSNSVRKSDTVARLSGDEFLVVLPDIKSHEAAEMIANKILYRLSQPISLLSKDITIGASIGIAFYPQHGKTSQALIKAADDAMYIIKKSGKNSLQIAPRP